MNPAASVIAVASSFLLGGGTGLLFWKSITRKTNAEGTDTITQATERIVRVFEALLKRLEDRIADLEDDHELCMLNTEALAVEVRRLGGNPAGIVSERRRHHRAGEGD